MENSIRIDESQSIERSISFINRIASAIIDHFIMSFLASVVFFSGMFLSGDVEYMISDEYNVFFMLGTSIYMCKDAIGGQSIGKRIMKLVVLNNYSESISSPLRCLIRNYFLIIWPIEIIFLAINPKRRIGDFVAGTKVSNLENRINAGVQLKSVLFILLLSFAFNSILFYLMTYVFKSLV